MKNSNLLQALMAGGIAIGIALGGAGLGVALKKPKQGVQGLKGEQGEKGDDGTNGSNGERGPQGEPGAPGNRGSKGDEGAQGIQGLKGERGPQGNAGADSSNDSLLRLSKIGQLGNKDNYYAPVPADSGGSAVADAAGKYFDDYLKTFNSDFVKRELTVATTAPENNAALNKPSLFGEKKTFMDEMFLVLTSKTTDLDIKPSFVNNPVTENEKKLIHVAVTNYGRLNSFVSGITLTITAPPETINGLDQRTKSAVWTITRDWKKTGAAALKYDIDSSAASKVVLNAAGFAVLKPKLGLAADEVAADWKIVATKSISGKANANGSDATTAVGVNKKTGQVAYYIAPGALTGSTNPTKIKIDAIKPTTS